MMFASCGKHDSTAPVPSGSMPNVFVVVVDTLRADHLSCYGYARATSPSLDALAEQGVLFDGCMTQWPKTGPAMAAFFSSTYGSKSGVARKTGRFPVPQSYDMFAEVLNAEGYETLAVISNSSLRKDLHYDQGFEHYEEAFTSGPESAARIAEQVKSMLDQRDRRRPYMMWAHFIDPHTPYVPPERLLQPYLTDATFREDQRGPAPIEPVANTLEENKPWRAAAITGIPRRYYVNGQEELRFYVAQYDAEIRYFDEVFGQLVKWMQREGHWQNTVVIVTADHGESLGEHNYYLEHGRYPYDACSRVPLILLHPDLEPRRIATPVAHIDVLPTVLESLELPNLVQAQGRSFWSALLAGDAIPERPVFVESGYRERFSVALRQGPWKMIFIPDSFLQKEIGCGPVQLFDVTRDPNESRDLWGVAPPVGAEMQRQLQEFQDRAYHWIQAPDNLTEQIPQLSPETRRSLENLGYLEDVREDR